jgi:hypothetical protein
VSVELRRTWFVVSKSWVRLDKNKSGRQPFEIERCYLDASWVDKMP